MQRNRTSLPQLTLTVLPLYYDCYITFISYCVIAEHHLFSGKKLFLFLRIMTFHMYKSKHRYLIILKEINAFVCPLICSPLSFFFVNQYIFSQYLRTNMTYLVMPNHMSKGMENMCEELMNND